MEAAGLALSDYGYEPYDCDAACALIEGMTPEQVDVVVASCCQDFEESWFRTPAERARFERAYEATYGAGWVG